MCWLQPYFGCDFDSIHRTKQHSWLLDTDVVIVSVCDDVIAKS